MASDSDFKHLLARVEELKKSGSFDLSLEEDLSIAVMNLVSLEEHFFFTAQKTGKKDYLKLLLQTREIRKQLLARMIDRHEGETWCVSKHLLAASMRIMEVATKLLSDGKTAEAEAMFRHSYEVYSLFWALRLKLLKTGDLKKLPDPPSSSPWKLSDLVTQLVDCCKE